jgi:pyruvate dehydrogenase E2 component (dihydrolipoamide acetyltransferase)
MITCTLSVDHRVVDGALGAEWLGVFKSIVEDPLSLML